MVDIVVVLLIFVASNVIVLYGAACFLLYALKRDGWLSSGEERVIEGVCEVIDS